MQRPPGRQRQVVDATPGAAGPLTLLLIASLVAILLGAPALAAPESHLRFDLDVADVRVGMEGYGVTAGPGNELVRFGVKVLAVQADAGPGFPLVLIRASGPFIDASGGVAAGMSGSPVYLGTATGDGLLGAIAYVFPSAAHDLALVTPIAAMRSSVNATTGPPRWFADAGLVPVSTPILMTGLGARAAALVAPLFGVDGGRVVPIQGGAQGPGNEEDVTLEPGSALSVQLTRGDVTIGAVGTVTTVDDGRVLAFGHPLLGNGAVRFVLSSASITAIVPSDVVPFKLANIGRSVLGIIDQDRPAAVGGALGDGPAMIPVSLHVNAPAGTRDYAFEVVPDERLYPQLVAAATLELLDRALSATTAGTAELAWQLELGSGTRLNLIDQADDADDIATAVARSAGSPLYALAVNTFAEPDLRSVDLSVRVTSVRRTADIKEVVVENAELAEGEPLIVHVRLQPYREEAIVRTMSIPIPDDLKGTVVVTIRGGAVRPDTEADDDEAPDDDLDTEPRSFSELLDAMRAHPQASELVAEVPGENGRPRRLARVPLERVITGSRTVDVTIAAEPDTTQAAPEKPEGDEREP